MFTWAAVPCVSPANPFQPDAWFRSVRHLLAEQATWPRGDVNERTFHVNSRPPSHRHALRRFFTQNLNIITTTPEDQLHVMDIPHGGAEIVMQRAVGVTRRPMEVIHAHDSATKLGEAPSPSPTAVRDPKDVRASHHKPLLKPESNPTNLDMLRYVTPYPVGSLRPTEAFFQPQRVTSKAPIVIGAGFEGTGLTTLSKAFELLGKDKIMVRHRVSVAAVPCASLHACCRCLPAVPGGGHGVTIHQRLPHVRLDDVVVHVRVAGQPQPAAEVFSRRLAVGPPGDVRVFVGLSGGVPKRYACAILWLCWVRNRSDSLPSCASHAAKVVLTVRDAELWHQAVTELSPNGFEFRGDGAALLRVWLWGVTSPEHLHKRLMLRKYYEHNAKVIHGVPKVCLRANALRRLAPH